MAQAARRLDATDLTDLRAMLARQFPDALPLAHRTRAQVATGVGSLDGILPGGGFPRAKMSAWAPQGGVTAILRAACRTTTLAGERAAWVDGDGHVAGAHWDEGPLLVRPKTRRHALRAAEELLRCGGFALLVVAGVEPQGSETVRLTRAAREGGSALVVVTPHASMSALRLESRLLPHSWRWRRTPFGDPAEARDVRVRVRARALGWNASTELAIPVTTHELRLSLDSELADRRGA